MDNNQYSYYQNLYKMFGGYNPLLDNKVKNLRRLGFIIGCGMIGVTLMQYVVVFLLQITGLYTLYSTDAVFQIGISAVSPLIYFFLPFLLVYLLYNKEERESVDIFDLPKSKELFIYSVFAGLLICSFGDRMATIFSAFSSVAGVEFNMPDSLEANTPLGYILEIIGYAIIPPLVEEFAMRGVVMQPLRKYGDKFAVVASALIFAALHGNMEQIPFAFISGLAMGYFAIITGSIWTSVAIHFLNNFLATINSIYYSTHSTDDVLFFYVMEGAILVVGIVALVLFIRMKPKKLTKGDEEISTTLKSSTFFCTPSIVVALFTSLLSSLAYTKISTSLGILLTFGAVIVIAILLIRGSMNAKNDTRITRSRMYSISTAITIIATLFISYFLFIMMLSIG